MLNLKVRLKQKWFWITLIPLLFLLIDQVYTLVTLMQTAIIGELFEGELQAMVIAAIGTLFAVLALIGFPVDLTTEGYGDSARALNYDVPAMSASEQAKLDYEAYLDETFTLNAKHADHDGDGCADLEEAKERYGRDFISMAEVRHYEACLDDTSLAKEDKVGGTD